MAQLGSKRKSSWAVKLTADHMYPIWLIDGIIPEPIGGAHWDYNEAAGLVKPYILNAINELKQWTPKSVSEADKEFGKDGILGNKLCPSRILLSIYKSASSRHGRDNQKNQIMSLYNTLQGYWCRQLSLHSNLMQSWPGSPGQVIDFIIKGALNTLCPWVPLARRPTISHEER